MRRIRNLRPDWLTLPSLATASPVPRLTMLYLMSIADDEGRIEGDANYHRAQLFPGGGTRKSTFTRGLRHLEEHGEIVRYEVAGKSLIALPGYCDPGSWQYQVIDRRRASRLPAPPEDRVPLRRIEGGERVDDVASGEQPQPVSEQPLTRAELAGIRAACGAIAGLTDCSQSRRDSARRIRLALEDGTLTAEAARRFALGPDVQGSHVASMAYSAAHAQWGRDERARRREERAHRNGATA
jgi:hypothetical protein